MIRGYLPAEMKTETFLTAEPGLRRDEAINTSGTKTTIFPG